MPNLVQIADLASASTKPKKKPTAEVLRDCLAEIVAGAGYVAADGSSHTCGDSNQSGLQCCLYRKKLKRCVILGPDLEITPSMTCIHDMTGAEIKAKPIVAAQPAEVGLVETYDGSNCERCDRLDKRDEEKPACYWLTDLLKELLAKRGYDGSGIKFFVEAGACCSFWANERVQKLIL